jgi:hypothetical protein
VLFVKGKGVLHVERYKRSALAVFQLPHYDAGLSRSTSCEITEGSFVPEEIVLRLSLLSVDTDPKVP